MKRSKKKIVITIDADLLEGTSDLYNKYGIDKHNIINTARWMFDCFEASIMETYSEGAPRLKEASMLRNKVFDQIVQQCSKKEIAENGWLNDYMDLKKGKL